MRRCQVPKVDKAREARGRYIQIRVVQETMIVRLANAFNGVYNWISGLMIRIQPVIKVMIVHHLQARLN